MGCIFFLQNTQKISIQKALFVFEILHTIVVVKITTKIFFIASNEAERGAEWGIERRILRSWLVILKMHHGIQNVILSMTEKMISF